MKKVLSLIVVVAFTTVAFAQDSKNVKSEPTKMEQAKPAAKTAPTKMAATTAVTSMSHECYMMKDGSLMHCTGDKSVAQKETVKLKNGTTVSPEGMISTSEGKESKMENGQCISLTGMIGDCEKMHASMKMNQKEKMGEAQPQPKTK